jgi:hypothetical protein
MAQLRILSLLIKTKPSPRICGYSPWTPTTPCKGLLTYLLRDIYSKLTHNHRSLASPTTFSSSCQNILERMINTVPSNVSLTQEIILLPVKVHDVQLTFERSKFVFKASLRVSATGTACYMHNIVIISSFKQSVPLSIRIAS